jgi:hypothetical protein
METPMDEATKPATRRAVDEFDHRTDDAPSVAPGDEKAYEDSWYRVLRGWETPAAEPAAGDDAD